MRGVFNVIMRIVSSLIGVLMTLMGCVWVLQGIGKATGRMAQSFMENDPKWAVYGAILAVVGICQVIWSNIRQGKAA
ncbi:MAG TPA: hypothetical protein VKU90_01680 [Caulobacteraceae bacterium]|jgi:hypothetical protein|nr:hypothetical protein [Caulobacteraceae bacterium]